MARALQEHAELQLLDLSGCGMSAASCSVLAEALASCASLRSLLLRDNPLGRAGARRVLRALQQGVCASHQPAWGRVCQQLSPHARQL